MNIFATLDVAAGLFFIYLVLSLVASETQERLASILQLRARNLRQTLVTILDRDAYEDRRGLQSVVGDFLAGSGPKIGEFFLFLFNQPPGDRTTPNLYRFYQRTTVNVMNPSVSWHPGRPVGPSYLEPSTFATAMMQLLRQLPQQKSQQDLQARNSQNDLDIDANDDIKFDAQDFSDVQSIRGLIKNENLPKSLQSNLLQLLDQAHNRYLEQLKPLESLAQRSTASTAPSSQNRSLRSHFNDELETWFERIMERSSGVYARTVKVLILLISLVLVVILNINTIDIVHELYVNQPLRLQFAGLAQTITDDQELILACTSSPDTSSETCQEALKANNIIADLSEKIVDVPTSGAATGLPIGWEFQDHDAAVAQSSSWEAALDLGKDLRDTVMAEFDNTEEGLETLLGWLISAIAISMGAPYWFDLLSKLTSIRNAGKKPS